LKRIYLCLLILLFAICCLSLLISIAQDQVIQITSPIEYRLFSGKRSEIETFIKKYQIQTNQFLSQLNSLLNTQLSDQQKKELQDAIVLLEGISFQLTRLKRQLKTKVQILSLPKLTAPPFKLDIFESYLSLNQKINQDLKDYKKKLRFLSTEISDIEENLKQLFTQYVSLQKDPTKKIEHYMITAQLMSLQIEYALRIIEKKHLEDSINRLNLLSKECGEALSKLYDNLSISKSDLQETAKEIAKLREKQVELKRVIISEQQKLNKDITLFELRLDNITNKLLSPSISDEGKRLLNIERERIKALLKRLQYRKEFLKQQLLDLRLKNLFLSFKYEWMENYLNKTGYQGTDRFIRKWSKELEKIKDELLQLKEKLDQRKSELSILDERIVRIEKEIQIEKDQLVKDSLSKLQSELKKNKGLLNSLVNLLLRNYSYTKDIYQKINEILILAKSRMSPFERVMYGIKNRLKSVWQNMKAVIYYPLWSISGTPVTIVTILKIILFLAAGIYFLRLIRKRLAKLLIEKVHLSEGVVNSISTLSYYFMLILVIFIALSTAGINLSQITIILGALGVGIGFGLQTIANNFISGLILLTERTIKVGDIVELENGLIGKVKDVSIRRTVIRTYDGLDIIVPNSDFIAGKVATWTYGDDWRRLRIPFGVSYNSDPDRVAEIAKEVARSIPTTIEDEDHPITVWFEGFGDSSLDFSLLVWCRIEKLKPITGLISDYYFALFRRFKEEGIEIPFPQRDIHIKSIPDSIFKKGDKDGI